MERLKLICIYLSSLFLVGSCAPVRVVEYQKNPSADLSSYKTFGFYNLEKEGLIGENFESNLEVLKNSIRNELSLRGYEESKVDAELLINIGVIVKEEVQTRQTDFQTDAYKYSGQRNYYWESKEVEINRYKEGTVRLEFVDAKQNTRVWFAAAAGTVTEKKEEVEKRISEAMKKLFTYFPIDIPDSNK